MIFRTLIGLFILMSICSCSQRTLNSGTQFENVPIRHLKLKNGLLIANDHYRGTVYTDSLGINYNIKYIPIAISNKSTIRIHLQIAFSKDYDYPIADAGEMFKVIPMPKEWVLDGGEITNRMIDELKDNIDHPFLNKTIEPGEKLVLAIGTVYPRTPKICCILPNALFTHNDGGILPTCDWLVKEDPSSYLQKALSLKLNFRDSCIIIPCGQISYPE